MSAHLPSISSKIYGFIRKNAGNSLIYCCSSCDLVFYSSSGLEAHIFDHKEFSDLPNEIVEQIFGYITTNDLAAMSLTCRRYRDLAETFFERELNCGRAFIKSSYETGRNRVRFIKPFASERYEICFRSFMPNVFVNIRDAALLRDTLRFIRDCCAKQLQQLAIRSFNEACHLDADHIRIIAEQVKHLKVLTLSNIPCSTRLLERCVDLQILWIDSGRPSAQEGAWINRTYTTLNTFILSPHGSGGRFGQENWSNFLLNNPQLRIVVCEAEFDARGLLLTGTPLPYAAISFTCKPLLQSIWNALEMCVNRRKIQSLDIIIGEQIYSGTILRRLINLNYIKGFHYSINHKNHSVFNDMDVQLNVERLCIRFKVKFSEIHLMKVVDCFPNLLELRIIVYEHTYSSVQTTFGISLKNILMPIIGRLAKLKHIYFINSKERMTVSKKELNELHWARTKLPNASYVTIHSSETLSDGLNASKRPRLVLVQQDSKVICPMCFPHKEPGLLISYLNDLPAICSSL